MTDCLAFVDKIAADATTILNLDDGVAWGLQADTVIGMPEMRRTTAGTLLTDGQQIPAAAYANRELRVSLKSLRADDDDAASDVQALVRQLDKTTNLLRYRPHGATEPVFFRTFRASPDEVAWDAVDRRVTVTIPAEPFGLGLRETIADGVVVGNDPATSGCKVDLVGVKGDVETPVLLEYDGSTSSIRCAGLALGVRAGLPYPSLVKQAEDGTLSNGADTSIVADPAFSNGSKRRCTFTTTTTMATRISGGVLGFTAENRGSYRVFARVAKTVGGDTIKMRMRVTTSGTARPYSQTVTLATGTVPQMVDLGMLRYLSTTRTLGLNPTLIAGSQAPTIEVDAERTAGSGSLDIDYLIFIPADYRYAVWGARKFSSSHLTVVDTANGGIYAGQNLGTSSPSVLDIVPAGLAGAFPMVRPGDNRLALSVVNPFDAATGNVLAETLTITVRYWPRYLYVRPVAT